jgi:hypothetical protein
MKRWWLVACLCVTDLFGMNVAQAAPSQLLESIEYFNHRGVAALEIGFAEPVQYLSHFPLQSGTRVQIFLGPRTAVDPDVDTLPYTQVMRAPDSKIIPLTQVTLLINEVGEVSVVLDFERVVSFAVQAGRNPNSLLVTLPEIDFSGELKVIAEQELTGTTPAQRLLVLGRNALKRGDNQRAIRYFTKILGGPESDVRREALELLGVARERNGQKAHAKALYREYLQRYAKTEGAARVKQRLNDLLLSQLQPKAPLKAVTKEKKKSTSQVYGSFAQYYYRGENSTEETGNTVDQSLLLSQLTLSWRIRHPDYEVRNFFYASQSEDFVSNAGKAPTIETAYSQIKSRRFGFSGKAGRQSATGGGVLGKFDGLHGSYDVSRTFSVNAVAGYPLDIGDKRGIQTEKPFWGIGFALDGEGKRMDILPYYVRQEVDGIIDREAVGSEFRFFNGQGNFYSLLDVDVSYGDLNIYLFRGQYNWRKDTILNLNFDYRNSPLLFTSNALIGRTDASSIADLLDILSEDAIRDLAQDRVGNAATLSLGVSHTFNARYQLNADVTYAQQTFVIDDFATGQLSEEDETQTYLSTQLIANQWFNDRDTTVLGLRLTQTGSYDEVSLSASNRLPLKKQWKFDTRLRADFRQGASGEDLTRYRPSLKWDYRHSLAMHFEMELGVEWWRYSGQSNNPDFQHLFANLGYRWNF